MDELIDKFETFILRDFGVPRAPGLAEEVPTSFEEGKLELTQTKQDNFRYLNFCTSERKGACIKVEIKPRWDEIDYISSPIFIERFNFEKGSGWMQIYLHNSRTILLEGPGIGGPVGGHGKIVDIIE